MLNVDNLLIPSLNFVCLSSSEHLSDQNVDNKWLRSESRLANTGFNENIFHLLLLTHLCTFAVLDNLITKLL